MAMPSAKTLLLFGPGAMSLDQTYFSRILSFVKDDAASQWAVRAIEDIESGWDALSESIPKLQQTPGADHARRLAEWLRTGVITPRTTVANLPNAILGPLVIIAQLVEYLQYVESSQSANGDGKLFQLPSTAQTETVGCCLGVFSALVVSSSSSWAKFHHNAAAVLRKVFVLGALSDAQDISDVTGSSVSLIAFWRGGQSLSDLKKVLEICPGAYISVLYDDNRATVTTPSRIASDLKGHLSRAGFTASETEFHGRFHAGELYNNDLEALFSFCRKDPLFQLPDASSLILRTRVNSEKILADNDSLLEVASRAFLVEQFNWVKTFRSAVSSSLQDRTSKVIEFGPERCVPPTLLRRLNSQVTHYEFQSTGQRHSNPDMPSGCIDNDIAVIGMSCQVAGAQDLEQYWNILLEGRSQHKNLVPNERFAMETVFRPGQDGEDRKWYGNFIDDYDAFDYKFFRKSPREVLHMDPQQRLILQTAYQAVAQSGYYHRPGADRRIGCYIGCVANDYENNISHTSPTAFSATGALRSYIAGKVSHYFGWTGPGMMLDTACSASTVAIDLACRAILSGDCSAALAGGTNFYSTPMFFQNLAAGSFLSPTGQCKPFDAKADGYCRGEAIGAVFLKKLSNAIADGDQILGVISATAINQNQNDTPIFVPNPSSLTNVFQNVVGKAGLEVNDISVVEAHGTGTPVGDPAEYDSIRQVFGGSVRAGLKPLQLGSVKGLIGHTEGASGVVALIKMLLMMQESRIPPQASFTSMSASIKASPADNMEITKAALPWEDESKVALINNYGAAGSNASMVIKQAPKYPSGSEAVGHGSADLTSPTSTFRCPFYISGLDDKAIRAYATRLRQFIKNKVISRDVLGIENLSFNVNRQSNWSLSRGFVFGAESITELEEKLASFETFAVPSVRPVILCFGGQVSKSVGLDRGVFDKATVLRKYLDRCDSVCKSIGAGSIYPGIFQSEPILDPAVLQPLLLSMQYSCALSWIDCGVEPAALVGHSFGELTALCVSGILSLEDALKLVHGRSKIIKESWGPEKGSMIAVEADRNDVEKLLVASNARLGETERAGHATIACFNGPKSFTIAGSAAAIDAVQQTVSTLDIPIKHKRLDVTNAFHSTLVEHLRPQLEALGRSLSFGNAHIPLERATEQRETGPISPAYVAEHMRNPVYFDHAVQRLASQYPEAIWLEAGSNSTITTMTGRALGMPKGSTFQPVSVTGTTQGTRQLADVTMSLWNAGLPCSFWPHSRAQTYGYAPIMLPPYQFEKYRHWLEFKPPPKPVVIERLVYENGGVDQEAPAPGLYTFMGYGDKTETDCQFRINTTTKSYVDIVSGYTLGKTVQACPPIFGIDTAIQAITSVRLEVIAANELHPHIYNVLNHLPLVMDPTRAVFLEFERSGHAPEGWKFKLTSEADDSSKTVHLSGQLEFHRADDARSIFEFSRLERLVTHERCLRALESADDADEVIQGQSIYKVYSDLVSYAPKFRGLQRLVGRPSESAGRVVKRRSRDSWLDFALGETFSQVGSIWVNCLAPGRNTADDTVYIADGIEQWMRSPSLLRKISEGSYTDHQSEWQILATHKRTEGDTFITDIFVFDSASRLLDEALLGVKFSARSMSELFTNVVIAAPPVPFPATIAPISSAPTENQYSSMTTSPPARAQVQKRNTKTELWAKLLPVLADISGLEPEEINETDALADIGIDSLMGMEMAREVETTFNCTLEQSELMSIFDVPGILAFLQSTLGLEGEDDASQSSDAASSSRNTPPSSNDGILATPSPKLEEEDISRSYIDLGNEVGLPAFAVIEAFRAANEQTDAYLKKWKCAGYLDGASQKQTRLCLVLTSDAFKQLGCDLVAAKPGEVLQPVPFVPRHHRFHEYLYKMLEETRIIDVDEGIITRTALPLPTQSSQAILDDLMSHHPDDGPSHQLTYNIGSRMADVLSGKADGPQLIFGDAKNRELVAAFYGELPFNKLYFQLMADFLSRIAESLRLCAQNRGPLKILEMGAGTGGTTKVLVPALAKLGIPVEYTFTDLSPSLVAQAKKKFKQYPFMKFAVHDIEQPPSDPLLIGSQHIVIASNAVHATHSLQVSTQNIRKFLRPDGFLMLLEMNSTLHWVDVVWGTLEGWWLFEDGRTHAVVDERQWEKELLDAGYKHVEWTDGKLPEVRVQRVIIALADDVEQNVGRLPPVAKQQVDDHDLSEEELNEKKQVADDYVKETIRGFTIPAYSGDLTDSSEYGKAVLVTGTTGSLGSHIIAHLVSLPSVDRVYCLNRPAIGGARAKDATPRDPLHRQLQSLESKSIALDASQLAKLKVIETDSSKAQLGLDTEEYKHLLCHVTHIIHNAFPVNGLRSLKQNEAQFTIMRNLVDLAAEISARRRATDFKFAFQFISSLSAVGKYPSVHGGEIQVPEEHLNIDSALPNGYGGAKVICERILHETLGQYPERFRAMTVRLGQLSGSMETGYWNHMEVLGFLFKSAQTLRSFPAVEGILTWLPLEQASATLADLLLRDAPDCHPVYHVDNPVRKPWAEIVPVLAQALGIPEKGIVPLDDWLRRVKAFPGEDPWDNPAGKAIDFFEHKFQHMSCGGVTMATNNAVEHSPTLRGVQPVADAVVRKYFQVWKDTGFLR